MSKKLIAVASAAALALSAFAAVPAGATAGVINVVDELNVTEGLTAKTAFAVNVPEDNEFTLTGEYLTIEVGPVVSNGTVSATSSGAVKILTSDELTDTETAADVKTGKSSFSEKAVGTANVTFYVYTTSTTPGALTIRNGDNVKVYYVAGVAGTPYNISAKFPSSLNSSTASKVDVSVSDVFGNAITTKTAVRFADEITGSTLTLDTVGAAAVEVEGNAFTWSNTRKAWVGEIIGTVGGGQASVTVTLDNGSVDYENDGQPAPKLTAFSTSSAADLATQIANLEAKLANSVSKAKYNNLVKKYNKITRGKKASLVK